MLNKQNHYKNVPSSQVQRFHNHTKIYQTKYVLLYQLVKNSIMNIVTTLRLKNTKLCAKKKYTKSKLE